MSRDKEVAKAYAVDPYVKLQGTLRGISDMLDRVHSLSLNSPYILTFYLGRRPSCDTTQALATRVTCE